MRKIAFDDQREKLAYLLDNHVPVLIYHGIFDMIIPISSTLRTINNTNWKRRDQWMTKERNPYYYTNENGIRELMGYNQSGGGLDFVLVLNSGHMVPIDQPSWSLKILEDFIINSQSVTRNRRDLNSDAGEKLILFAFLVCQMSCQSVKMIVVVAFKNSTNEVQTFLSSS